MRLSIEHETGQYLPECPQKGWPLLSRGGERRDLCAGWIRKAIGACWRYPQATTSPPALRAPELLEPARTLAPGRQLQMAAPLS